MSATVIAAAIGLTIVVAVVAVAGPLAVSAAGQAPGLAARASARCKSPTAQPPNAGSRNNGLNDVAAISHCRAWAVGFYKSRGGTRNLILYWNGKRWKVQRSPNPGSFPRFDVLFGVAATTATNAWAVGYYSDHGKLRTLIERWNGKAWKAVPSPNAGSSPNGELGGVAATSSTDAWAVGNYFPTTSAPSDPLIEHWDGKTWKVEPSPGFSFAGLIGVAATSARNAWAVGSYGGGTLIEHWDGKAWERQHSFNGAPANDPQSFNGLYGVAATSANKAWAVGSSYSHFSSANRNLIEDWNGTAWKFHRSGTRSQYYSQALYGVAATSATHAWAVGYYRKGTLITYWNGKAWNIQRSPNPGPLPRRDVLYGVAATSPTNAWAVGQYDLGGRKRNLALHWNGTHWGP